MMDDEVGSLVEKLKPQFVTKWLKTVCDVRFDVMVMCLLPKPMEFARVSGGCQLKKKKKLINNLSRKEMEGRMDTCLCMNESLCWSPETI